MYTPKAFFLFTCEREKKIFNQFTYAYLSKKYGLSLQ
ncbi:hypothetical protein [Rodentibacter caecimuris]